MRIVVFEWESREKDPFTALETEGHQISFVDEALNESNASRYADAEILSPFIYSKLDADILRQFANLKLIAARSTGVDHVDLEYCRQHGIAVCNVSGYGKHTVAEHVFGLLLVISHRIYDAIERTRDGDFSFLGLRGFELWGKTLGVLGTGEIGGHVLEIAKGFGMNAIAADQKPDSALASRLGFTYATLEEVLARADILTIHVPANPSTHHLISKREFERMKPGVILINTARGNVVDVQALLQALLEGKVAAAGLDVLPEEPAVHEMAELLRAMLQDKNNLKALLADYALLQLKNVYITPHSAFNTREAEAQIVRTTVENIRAFLQGKTKNQVSV